MFRTGDTRGRNAPDLPVNCTDDATVRYHGSQMIELTGRTIEIAGMVVEILAVEGDNLVCRNLTTRHELTMDKAVVEQAIRLGKAEIVSREPGA